MRDPLDDLPEPLRQLLSQLGGAGVLQQLRLIITAADEGPVSWTVARQLAAGTASPGDRPPTPQEQQRISAAHELAEHWLDEGTLPAPPDAGRLLVTSRVGWLEVAVPALRELIEPVASAAARTVAQFAARVPGENEPLLKRVAAVIMGIQTGHVLGVMARGVISGYELGVPSAPPGTAVHVPVNVEAAFAGYDLDPEELAVVLALTEGAYRRLYHAVRWLPGHVRDLVATFAAHTDTDPDPLIDAARSITADLDLDDPASIPRVLERVGEVPIRLTPAQERTLERLHTVLALIHAWARAAVREAARGRVPQLERIEEVLRRRRAEGGDGERLLAFLLGLDLVPREQRAGERFVAEVAARRGLGVLRRALAHPENLPDVEELADPARWLERLESAAALPDDLSDFEAGGPEERPDDQDDGS